MSQRYVFIFTDKRIAIVAVAVVMNALLLIIAGVLIGLQIYPDVASSGPQKKVAEEKWTTNSPPPKPAPKPAPKPDSTLTYILNTIQHSETEVVKLPEAQYYTLQMGNFAGNERAEHRRTELQKKGISAYIYRSADKNKQWYEVRAGLFDNSTAARRTSKQIRKKHGVQPVVRPLGAE